MSSRNLELNVRAKADVRDLEKLSRNLDTLVSDLRKTSAAFDQSGTSASKATVALSALTAEEMKQLQAAARTASALEQAATARERSNAAAANSLAAEERMTIAQERSEQAALRTATAQETLQQAQLKTATTATQSVIAEEKLAQEREKTAQATVKTEKAEIDTAKAREQLRLVTIRAEQAEKKATETKRSFGLATDIVNKQIQAFVSGAALYKAGQMMLQFGRESLQAASDAEEGAAKFQQVFRSLSEGVEADLKKMADSNRRSLLDLRDYASELQNTFVPLGFAREQAAEFSKTITQLGIDIAAFSNKADADVIHNLTSAIVGNHMAVRSYGIVITDTVLRQELMRLGAENLTGAALETAKAQARLNVIMRATADAQGAAVREADSYANVLKAWDASVKDLKVALGDELLPTMVQLTEAAIDLVKALQFDDEFKAPIEASLEAADTLDKVVDNVIKSRQRLSTLDFWDWIKINATSWTGLDLAEKQILRIADLSKDTSEFQKTVIENFSRIDITTVADKLDLEPSWNLDKLVGEIYKAVQAKKEDARETAHLTALTENYRRQVEELNRLPYRDPIDIDIRVAEQQTQILKGASNYWDKYAAALESGIGKLHAASDAQKIFNQAFGEAYQNAPVEDLLQAQKELANASGEWRSATIDNSGQIARIQAQLAADLTDAQKNELKKQLKDLDQFSSEYLAIVGQLDADLSDAKRFDLVKQLDELERRQGQHTSIYTGDVKAAEEAQRAIVEANEAIAKSHYQRAYDAIAARMIEAGEFEALGTLAVSLGLMTQEEVNLRNEYARTAEALTALTESTSFYNLTAGQQGDAIKSLVTGMYDTADAAMAAQKEIENLQKFYSTAPDSTAIGDFYRDLANGGSGANTGIDLREPITTVVSVSVDPASLREFTGYREELENYSTAVYETTIQSDAKEAMDDFDRIRDDLTGLTENAWVIKIKYETEGTPPGTPGYVPPGGSAPRVGGDKSERGRGVPSVDVVVNNYGGGPSVEGAVHNGVLSAFRSLG